MSCISHLHVGVASAVVVLLASCATPRQEIGAMVIPKKDFEKLAVTIENHEHNSGNKSQPLFSESNATDAFKFLCKGGKPRKKVSHQFSFVNPKPKAGMALDDAKDTAEKIHLLRRALVANFYRLLTFGRYSERARMDIDSSQGGSQVPRFPVINLASVDTSKIATEQKRNSVTFEGAGVTREPDGGLSGDEVGSMIEGFRPRFAPQIFVGPKSKLLMTFVDTRSFFKDEIQRVESLPVQTTGIIVPGGDMIEVIPFELLAIRQWYALVVTENEASAWASVAKSRMSGLTNKDLPDDLERGGKPLPQSDLLSQVDDIFANFLVANTAIRESTTADGQVFSYALSLNTEPLCRLGRLRTSLESN